MTSVLQEEIRTQTHTETVKRPGDAIYKERGLEGTRPADTLALDFQPPDCLWNFAMAALGN